MVSGSRVAADVGGGFGVFRMWRLTAKHFIHATEVTNASFICILNCDSFRSSMEKITEKHLLEKSSPKTNKLEQIKNLKWAQCWCSCGSYDHFHRLFALGATKVFIVEMFVWHEVLCRSVCPDWGWSSRTFRSDCWPVWGPWNVGTCRGTDCRNCPTTWTFLLFSTWTSVTTRWRMSPVWSLCRVWRS